MEGVCGSSPKYSYPKVYISLSLVEVRVIAESSKQRHSHVAKRSERQHLHGFAFRHLWLRRYSTPKACVLYPSKKTKFSWFCDISIFVWGSLLDSVSSVSSKHLVRCKIHGKSLQKFHHAQRLDVKCVIPFGVISRVFFSCFVRPCSTHYNAFLV